LRITRVPARLFLATMPSCTSLATAFPIVDRLVLNSVAISISEGNLAIHWPHPVPDALHYELRVLRGATAVSKMSISRQPAGENGPAGCRTVHAGSVRSLGNLSAHGAKKRPAK